MEVPLVGESSFSDYVRCPFFSSDLWRKHEHSDSGDCPFHIDLEVQGILSVHLMLWSGLFSEPSAIVLNQSSDLKSSFRWQNYVSTWWGSRLLIRLIPISLPCKTSLDLSIGNQSSETTKKQSLAITSGSWVVLWLKFGNDRGRLSKCFSFIIESVQIRMTERYPHSRIDGNAYEVICHVSCIKFEHECVRIGTRPLRLASCCAELICIIVSDVDFVCCLFSRSTD